MQCPSILCPSQARPLILLPQGLLEPHCSEQGMELLRCVLGIFRKIRTGSGMGGMGELWLSYPRGRGSSRAHSHPKGEPCCHSICPLSYYPVLSLPIPSAIVWLRPLHVPSVLRSLWHPFLCSSTRHPSLPGSAILLSLCPPSCAGPARSPGYKDVVVHEALAEVAHDGILSDLGQQHHVVHTALFHIVALPVEALLAALGVGVGGGEP